MLFVFAAQSVDAEQEDVQKPEAKSTDSAVENPDLSNHSSSVDAPSQRRPSFRSKNNLIKKSNN